jgi:hypothetical protein
MSDYRNPDFDPFDPNDPHRRDGKMGPDLRPSNTVTGWVVAVVFVVALLGVIYGMSRQTTLGTNTASNEIAQPGTSPAATHMAPPTPPTSTPSPQPITKPPINPVPPAPAPSSGGQ